MLYNNIARTEKNSVNNILHVLDAIIYAIRDQILILYIHSMQVDLFCLARYRLCARLDILISIQSVMNLSIYQYHLISIELINFFYQKTSVNHSIHNYFCCARSEKLYKKIQKILTTLQAPLEFGFCDPVIETIIVAKVSKNILTLYKIYVSSSSLLKYNVTDNICNRYHFKQRLNSWS